MVFRQYLSLPFSYMTFVIKAQLEKDDSLQVGNQFDLEPFNYLFNRGTCFTDSKFVYEDHNLLKDVLSNFDQIDPELLEILHYIQKLSDDEMNSVIHLAVKNNNNRSVDTLLRYMAQIKQNSSINFADLFNEFVAQQGFEDYL